MAVISFNASNLLPAMTVISLGLRGSLLCICAILISLCFWRASRTFNHEYKLNKSYRPSLEKGSGQLIVTLYTLSIYPSVHNQLIQTLYKTQIGVQSDSYFQPFLLCTYIKKREGILKLFNNYFCYIHIQLISYKRYLECTLVQWRLFIIPEGTGSCGYLLNEIPGK